MEFDRGSEVSMREPAVVAGMDMARFVPVPMPVGVEAGDIGSDDPLGSPNRAAALLRALQRLESVVDEEVAALRRRHFADFDQFARRKNRGLLELVRSGRAAGEARRDPAVAARIAGLREKLRHNHHVLRLHFDAVRAVAEIIGRVLREAESDGTYPPTARAKEER